MVKKHILCFFTSLRRRRGRRLAPLIKHLRARSMPAHLTAMDGGNAEGLQEQSRPCAGRRLAKNRVSHRLPTGNGIWARVS
jgi:hypothetical protein